MTEYSDNNNRKKQLDWLAKIAPAVKARKAFMKKTSLSETQKITEKVITIKKEEEEEEEEEGQTRFVNLKKEMETVTG